MMIAVGILLRLLQVSFSHFQVGSCSVIIPFVNAPVDLVKFFAFFNMSSFSEKNSC